MDSDLVRLTGSRAGGVLMNKPLMVAAAVLGMVTPEVANAGPKKQIKRTQSVPFNTANIQGAPEGAPEAAVWRSVSKASNSAGITIERISGCHGERDAARNRVLGHKGVVVQPELRGDTFTPGVLDASAIGVAGCVTDDEPTEMDALYDEILELEFYMALEVYECNCGQCVDLETDKWFDESEMDAMTTPAHRAAYERYRIKRTAEVAKNRIAYAGYSANYNEWLAKRSATLTQSAIRIQVTVDQPMPAGRLAVYTYDWSQYSWCGDTSEAKRVSMDHWTIERPALAVGETLEVWVDGIDVRRAWGVVLGNDEAGLQRDVAAIEAESERRMQSGEGDLRALPASVQGRSAETTGGASAYVMDECCS